MPNVPDAVVLCGGAGLRLRSVTGDCPKSMAEVAGTPFLELLMKQLRRHGFQRVILAVGHRREAIRAHFGEHAFDMELTYSMELKPLGTGGAIRNAVDLIRSGEALIMNGDSYTDADLGQLVANHQRTGADVSVVVVATDRRDDVGYLRVSGSGRLIAFNEKADSGHSPYANAGIYLMARAILTDIPPGVPVSLEKDLFPRWIAENRNIRTHIHAGVCVDIGTPERYQRAQESLANVEATSKAGEAS